MTDMVLVSERNTKYYDKDLKPVYEVPRSKVKILKDEHGNVIGESHTRPPTVTDAKKLGLDPSNSLILNMLGSYGLELFKMEQCIRASMGSPFQGKLEDEDAVKTYINGIYAKSGEYARECADAGTAIHKDVEVYFTDHIMPESMVSQKAIIQMKRKFENLGINAVLCEHTLKGRGYVTTPDLVLISHDGRKIIGDMKTIESLNKKTGWPFLKWKLQLGAGWNCEVGADIMSVVIGRDTGDVKFITYTQEEAENFGMSFMLLTHLWERTCCKGGFR